MRFSASDNSQYHQFTEVLLSMVLNHILEGLQERFNIFNSSLFKRVCSCLDNHPVFGLLEACTVILMSNSSLNE